MIRRVEFMETVIIVIHLMVVLALVGVVLLQRSEGGGLGIGGGSGFMTARGAANALTRATAILAVAFFATSLGLSIIARYGAQPIDILDRVPPAGQGEGACSTSSAAPTCPRLRRPRRRRPAEPPLRPMQPLRRRRQPRLPPLPPADVPAAPAAPAQPAEPQVPNQ